jgi:hypothetical protein
MSVPDVVKVNARSYTRIALRPFDLVIVVFHSDN